jgi:hypothetical protein
MPFKACVVQLEFDDFLFLGDIDLQTKIDCLDSKGLVWVSFVASLQIYEV